MESVNEVVKEKMIYILCFIGGIVFCLVAEIVWYLIIRLRTYDKWYKSEWYESTDGNIYDLKK